MNPRTLTLIPLLALLVACGGQDKDKSTTPEGAIGKSKSALTGTEGGESPAAASKSAEIKVADNTPAPQPSNPPAAAPPSPAPAAAPAPAPAAAPGTQAPPPTGLVRDALLKVRQGKHEDAIRAAKAALKRDEKYVPAMVVMARAYYQLGKLEFCDAICDIAIGINASTGECYNLKGFVALKNKQEVVARQMFEKATQVQPNLGPPWLNLGGQYLKVKNYKAAIGPLQKATQLMPGRAEAQLNLGSAYRGDGQLAQAFAAYTKALKLKNNSYPAAYFNLGILFLDADKYPGMDKLQQLNTAVSYFTKYKQSSRFVDKNDPVDGYIEDAQKAYKREQKRIEREAKKKARAAARKAKQAEEAKKKAEEAAQPKPAEGAKPAEGGAAQPATGGQ